MIVNVIYRIYSIFGYTWIDFETKAAWSIYQVHCLVKAGGWSWNIFDNDSKINVKAYVMSSLKMKYQKQQRWLSQKREDQEYPA